MPSFKVVFMYLQDLNLCFHCFSLLQKKHQTVTPMGASLNAQWLTMGLAATVDMVTRLLQMERRVKVGGAPANLFWLSQPKPKYNATALIFPRRKVFYIFFFCLLPGRLQWVRRVRNVQSDVLQHWWKLHLQLCGGIPAAARQSLLQSQKWWANTFPSQR